MSKKFSSTIENAIRLASFWHRDQVYAEGEFDYFNHCVSVASIITRHGFDEDTIAAAYCHDTLESTDCPEDEIKLACGLEVLRIVYGVTENRHGSFSWKEKKENFVKQLKFSNEKAWAVCVAEQIHNIYIMIDGINENGLSYFDDYEAGPEDRLWFDDQLYMMISENWQHSILEEYDELIDELVNLMEEFNKEDEYERKVDRRRKLKDFDEPDWQLRQSDRLTVEEIAKEENHNERYGEVEQEDNSAKQNKKKKKERKLGKYLANDEFKFLLPAAVSLGLKQKEITGQDLQEFLEINYLLSYKMLKEMKRLHIISRADSFKPRKIDITKAKEFLKKYK